jgi:hypothetical protein
MKTLVIDKGRRVATLDDEDYEWAKEHCWFVATNGYVFRHRKAREGTNKPTTILMHREVMGASSGQEVDHIDSDKLNNQKANLRFCEHHLNCQRTAKKGKHGFIGVEFLRGRYYTKFHNKRYFAFQTPQEAAAAYNAVAVSQLGHHAQTNQVDPTITPVPVPVRTRRKWGCIVPPKKRSKRFYVLRHGRVFASCASMDEAEQVIASNQDRGE